MQKTTTGNNRRSAAEQSRLQRLGAKRSPTLGSTEKAFYSGELHALQARHTEALAELDQ